MRLGIDLDGVVTDFNAGWMRLHAQEFGSDLRPEMVDSWDCLHRLAGFDDMREFWRWASPKPHRRSIFRTLEPYPGAIEALGALSRSGHRIVIITNKPHWARTDTFEWLAEHDLATTEVHLSNRKSAVDCDAYVDDAPHVLHELVEQRPDAIVCRYVRPWNRPVDGAVDVADFGDVERLLASRPPAARTTG